VRQASAFRQPLICGGAPGAGGGRGHRGDTVEPKTFQGTLSSRGFQRGKGGDPTRAGIHMSFPDFWSTAFLGPFSQGNFTGGGSSRAGGGRDRAFWGLEKNRGPAGHTKLKKNLTAWRPGARGAGQGPGNSVGAALRTGVPAQGGGDRGFEHGFFRRKRAGPDTPRWGGPSPHRREDGVPGVAGGAGENYLSDEKKNRGPGRRPAFDFTNASPGSPGGRLQF